MAQHIDLCARRPNAAVKLAVRDQAEVPRLHGTEEDLLLFRVIHGIAIVERTRRHRRAPIGAVLADIELVLEDGSAITRA
jgi:hypothetical protein